MYQELLNNIAETLTDKRNLISDQGRAKGSVGIAFFLFHYYKISGNEVCGNAVSELVMEMMERLTTKQELLQRNELLDISWFLKYLVDNDFLDLETDELLVSIDDIYADVEYSVGYPSIEYLLKVIGFFLWRRTLIHEELYLEKIDQILARFVKEIVMHYQQEIRVRLLEKPAITTNIIQKRTFHTTVRSAVSILSLLNDVIDHVPAITPQFINEVAGDLNEVLMRESKRVPDNNYRCLMDQATDFYIHYAISKYGINGKDNESLIACYLQKSNSFTLANPSDLPDLVLVNSCLYLLESGKYYHEIPVAVKKNYIGKLAAVGNLLVSGSTLNGLPNMGLRDGIAGAGLVLLTLSGEYKPDLENIFPFN